MRKTFTYKQLNTGNIRDVFPLLCPVREADWLDGWRYSMIHSVSGLIEQGCVFTTPHHGQSQTVWYVTQHDPINYNVEFVRVTPEEAAVKITIALEAIDNDTTQAHITYEYTGLSDGQNHFIETKLADEFEKSMNWWEKAINHYLKTGEKLLKK
ncbi:MAG: hypothetical protein KF725_02945 [Cyclobacteriaceae bacterium]|nr:hypothetical protein [Cyclobacteriaceae bacterium]UYN86608.1 MAG: hypothetical protein KIT51_17390 [Cyclobacteriaceae bacterium]